ncbi:VacJ family lipoprotein [Rhodobacteraceae bacterium CCMM004]|nr:VacJ family lipoprotein [Rhodobacteraceae bacterium CCMM004]
MKIGPVSISRFTKKLKTPTAQNSARLSRRTATSSWAPSRSLCCACLTLLSLRPRLPLAALRVSCRFYPGLDNATLTTMPRMMPALRAVGMPQRSWIGLCAAVAVAVAGCGRAPLPDGISDPHEAQNRATFEMNRRVDAALSFGGGEGGGVPEPVTRTVGNLANHLELPRSIVNDVLQANVEDAVHNGFRLALNTLVGVGGLFDPATSMGLEERESDFGETLHVWGQPEGAYLVLPLIGPSTERDAFGRIVDTVLDPVGWVLPRPEVHYARGVSLADNALDRAAFADTIDSIVNDSADGYAQARLLYLESRRYELRGGAAPENDDYFDPYEDPYAQ